MSASTRNSPTRTTPSSASAMRTSPASFPGTFGGLGRRRRILQRRRGFSYRSFATSWTHMFTPEVVNEFRLGYNRINAQRLQLNANTNVSADPSIDFPGCPIFSGHRRFAATHVQRCRDPGQPDLSAFDRTAEFVHALGKPDLGARDETPGSSARRFAGKSSPSINRPPRAERWF